MGNLGTANKTVTGAGISLRDGLGSFVTHLGFYRCRRKLRSEVAAVFPTLSTEQLAELVPNKEELNVIKIYSHKGEAITVYMNHRNPILFEVEKVLYPTGKGEGTGIILSLCSPSQLIIVPLFLFHISLLSS